MPIDPPVDFFAGFIPDHVLSYGLRFTLVDDGNPIRLTIMFTVNGAIEYSLTEQGVEDLDSVAQDLVNFLAAHPKLTGYVDGTKLWDTVQSITPDPTPSEG